jgi:hypothetical protein
MPMPKLPLSSPVHHAQILAAAGLTASGISATPNNPVTPADPATTPRGARYNAPLTSQAHVNTAGPVIGGSIEDVVAAVQPVCQSTLEISGECSRQSM